MSPTSKIGLRFAMLLSSCLAAGAQSTVACQPTLQYLSSSIPTTGYAPLDSLRQQLLVSDMREVMTKVRSQGMSLETAISLANKQADADEAALPSLETSIRGAIVARRADGEIADLKSRRYANVSLGDDVLGASVRAYIADDWGALANRETAKQLRCFELFSVTNSSHNASSTDQQAHTYAQVTKNDSAAARSQNTSLKPDEPSLEETTKFIQDHAIVGGEMKTAGTWSGSRNDQIEARWVYSDYLFTKCVLHETSEYELDIINQQKKGPARYGDIRYRSYSNLDLSNLLPNTVGILSEQAETNDRHRKQGEKLTVSLSSDIYLVSAASKKDTQNILFATQDKSLAIRVSKAFEHAITFCGGKAEVF